MWDWYERHEKHIYLVSMVVGWLAIFLNLLNLGWALFEGKLWKAAFFTLLTVWVFWSMVSYTKARRKAEETRKRLREKYGDD